MDISKSEQRILHVLAQGGCIELRRDDDGTLEEMNCITRDGWYYAGLSEHIFRKLKYRRLISSKGGRPYRITKLGLSRVRSQLDNR
ncbi:YjhX family toxin [Pseudovibrio sp. JE062]|uniref:YjhX family toxin n=1 Tax=Pseudovibrio sp. JE062 TaxID=439495 RepID=UPI000186BD4D|nr:YjhX family toxin [Pseudovibrio sp. JE062]EEA91945.1 hypothetical protein PJE062_3570 [Pseudovibrio sp. JE062]